MRFATVVVEVTVLAVDIDTRAAWTSISPAQQSGRAEPSEESNLLYISGASGFPSRPARLVPAYPLFAFDCAGLVEWTGVD